MKRDQQRVTAILVDTISLICRKGLVRQHELRIQGVIAITIDDSDTFAVHMNETVNGAFDDVLLSDDTDELIGLGHGKYNESLEDVLLSNDVENKVCQSRHSRFLSRAQVVGNSQTKSSPVNAIPARLVSKVAKRSNGRLDFVRHQAKKILASLSVTPSVVSQETCTSPGDCEPQENNIHTSEKCDSMMDSSESENCVKNDWNMRANGDEAFDTTGTPDCPNNSLFSEGVSIKAEPTACHDTDGSIANKLHSSAKSDVLRFKQRQRIKKENLCSSGATGYMPNTPDNDQGIPGYTSSDVMYDGSWEAHESKPNVRWSIDGSDWSIPYGNHSNEMNTEGSHSNHSIANLPAHESRLLESKVRERGGSQSYRRVPSEIDLKTAPNYGSESFDNEILSRFVCSYAGCGASFTNKPNLLRHQTTKHGREKTYGKRRRDDIRAFMQEDFMASAAYSNFNEGSQSVDFL